MNRIIYYSYLYKLLAQSSSPRVGICYAYTCAYTFAYTYAYTFAWIYARSPRMRRASCMSRTIIVTRLA